MCKLGAFIAGFLGGALIAGISVVLFTPYSGKALQGRIKAESEKIICEVKAASEQKQKELKQELENYRLGKNIKLESVDPGK